MFAAALTMTSCGLYNKYERPEVNTQGLVRDPLSLTDTLAVTGCCIYLMELPYTIR